MTAQALLVSFGVLLGAVVVLGRPARLSLAAVLAAMLIGGLALVVALFAPGPPRFLPAPLSLAEVLEGAHARWALGALLGLPAAAWALKARS